MFCFLLNINIYKIVQNLTRMKANLSDHPNIVCHITLNNQVSTVSSILKRYWQLENTIEI